MDNYHVFCASCRKTEERRTTVRESDNDMHSARFNNCIVVDIYTRVMLSIYVKLKEKFGESSSFGGFEGFKCSHLIVSLIRIITASPQLLSTLSYLPL